MTSTPIDVLITMGSALLVEVKTASSFCLSVWLVPGYWEDDEDVEDLRPVSSLIAGGVGEDLRSLAAVKV
ncbi:hypothetical protein Ddye_016397 [Dipteronia dyeriana]|uniref:Uncharacterized protein n=1 Tax=Dipteronia dyeriana TaxID=168575 RepID=A0AAD9U7F6_9ROSI|nr:hypothetical protein Ddye_016397 [Dipteronia dyeriana]